MSYPVIIESDALKMEVWPTVGGKIASLIDKADQFELLFSYPDELPQGAQYDIPYVNSWYQGWDECFPAIAPSKYVGHPYDGVAVPDHGELWGIPTTAVPTKNGITTVWHGLRFGYRLTRKLTLEGSSLLAEYTLVNLAPFPFRFVWAAHALMSVTGGFELELGGDLAMRGRSESHADTSHPFYWPKWDEQIDLSRYDSVPARRGLKCFSVDPISQPAIVRYPLRGRQMLIEYASDDISAFWGIWINTGGWARQSHVAVEPTTGRSDLIDHAISDKSAGIVQGSGKVQWKVVWTVQPSG